MPNDFGRAANAQIEAKLKDAESVAFDVGAAQGSW
jgi:hypothetical protein